MEPGDIHCAEEAEASCRGVKQRVKSPRWRCGMRLTRHMLPQVALAASRSLPAAWSSTLGSCFSWPSLVGCVRAGDVLRLALGPVHGLFASLFSFFLVELGAPSPSWRPSEKDFAPCPAAPLWILFALWRARRSLGSCCIQSEVAAPFGRSCPVRCHWRLPWPWGLHARPASGEIP